MEEYVVIFIVIVVVAFVEFNLGDTSGKKSVCSQFKEHILTTEGKCIKVEQDQPKEK